MKKTKLILPLLLTTILATSYTHADTIENKRVKLGMPIATSVEPTIDIPIAKETNKIKDEIPFKTIAIDKDTAKLLQIIINTCNGFVTGDNIKMTDIPLLIFFDPQCDVCKTTWKNATNSNNKNVNAFWIPIGLLNEDSAKQANTIISSSDPKKAMNDLINGSLMIKETDKGGEKIEANNYIFAKMDIENVPLILKITKDNRLIIANHYLSEADIKLINGY